MTTAAAQAGSSALPRPLRPRGKQTQQAPTSGLPPCGLHSSGEASASCRCAAASDSASVGHMPSSSRTAGARRSAGPALDSDGGGRVGGLRGDPGGVDVLAGHRQVADEDRRSAPSARGDRPAAQVETAHGLRTRPPSRRRRRRAVGSRRRRTRRPATGFEPQPPVRDGRDGDDDREHDPRGEVAQVQGDRGHVAHGGAERERGQHRAQ